MYTCASISIYMYLSIYSIDSTLYVMMSYCVIYLWVSIMFENIPSPAWAENTVHVCVCVSVCVLPQNCCKFQLSQNPQGSSSI